MEVSLAGRTAVITGGSKGIGLAIATRFAASGADVAIIARGRGALDEAVKSIGAGAKGRVAAIAGDVGVAADIKRAYDEAMAALGKIDIVVNNAGTSRTGAFEEITDEVWRDDFDQKLFAAIRLTRLVWPQMKERRWGRVIHISSVLGTVSKEGRNAYSATKSALMGLARASALDLGPFGITVNCIAPGPFLTDLPMSILSDAEKKVFADRTALLRWGDPKEMMGPALLLASDAGSYITGTTLVVDGGFLAR
jgi:NAD(P)-dependent dehydrogenase (short-subunit alcohol dehydrogenase family)